MANPRVHEPILIYEAAGLAGAKSPLKESLAAKLVPTYHFLDFNPAMIQPKLPETSLVIISENITTAVTIEQLVQIHTQAHEFAEWIRLQDPSLRIGLLISKFTVNIPDDPDVEQNIRRFEGFDFYGSVQKPDLVWLLELKNRDLVTEYDRKEGRVPLEIQPGFAPLGRRL